MNLTVYPGIQYKSYNNSSCFSNLAEQYRKPGRIGSRVALEDGQYWKLEHIGSLVALETGGSIGNRTTGETGSYREDGKYRNRGHIGK